MKVAMICLTVIAIVFIGSCYDGITAYFYAKAEEIRASAELLRELVKLSRKGKKQ